MTFDFGGVGLPGDDSIIVQPVDLFRSLRVLDPDINDLWLAQGDALREWHENRGEADIAISLNTGAGKTLVGLLIAQSLVNETGGRVLYACSSIQLVEQTAEKAALYGLDVSTYVRGEFSNSLFHEGRAPCITTYQALFNGRARRIAEDVEAVVFDDAHAAAHILRDQFTLHVSRAVHPVAYGATTAIFQDYFDAVGQGTGYRETTEGQGGNQVWFVPPSEVRRQCSQLRDELLALEPNDDPRMMFPWGYLRDHLDLCAVTATGQAFSLTPPFIPLNDLPYFSPTVRRVYLSATLQAKDGFAKVFGRLPDRVIAPSTTAGECERLILIPKLSRSAQSVADTETARAIIKGHKALVIVPSDHRRRMWDDVSTEGDAAAEDAVRAFRDKQDAACLVLAARYDGMDLPGDTCRMLVIDDLPSGLNSMERYLWEQLGQTKVLRSTVASRVVQSLGRISRGMSDHGVVVLTGDRLVDWLTLPRNRSLLPPFLQRQLAVGTRISRDGDAASFPDAAAQCLGRGAAWLTYYDGAMKSAQAAEPPDDADEAAAVALVEARFMTLFWQRRYNDAAIELERNLDKTFEHSAAAGAWHALWLSYASELAGQDELADNFYRRALNAKAAIPRRRNDFTPDKTAMLPSQVAAICQILMTKGRVAFPERFGADTAALNGPSTPKRVEAALESLGSYLGLDSRRPDNDLGTGPDVLWRLDGQLHLSLEAKTDKQPTTSYRKDEQGQLRDHLSWVRETFGADVQIRSAFVGELLPPSADSNPEHWMDVLPLQEFKELRRRTETMLRQVADRATPFNLGAVVQESLAANHLVWPQLGAAIPGTPLASLKPSR